FSLSVLLHLASSCSLFSALFFVIRYLAHRALHSFPTRRSSDLRILSFTMILPSDRASMGWIFRIPATRLCSPEHRPPLYRYSMVDRKSTRLNSSHVKISYAVFCLKKKKKYTTNINQHHKRA